MVILFLTSINFSTKALGRSPSTEFISQSGSFVLDGYKAISYLKYIIVQSYFSFIFLYISQKQLSFFSIFIAINLKAIERTYNLTSIAYTQTENTQETTFHTLHLNRSNMKIISNLIQHKAKPK